MKEKIKESIIYDDPWATKEDLSNEAKLRANSDNMITANINSLWEDYEIHKKINDAILNNKQNKSDNNLTTNNKTIIGSINEINADKSNLTELQNQVTKNTIDISEIKIDYIKSDDLNDITSEKQDKLDNNLITADKTIVGAINEIKEYINLLSVNSYKNFKEITINNKTYVFDEYDENYWHMFVFEFENKKKKVSGILERPAKINSNFTSQNAPCDYPDLPGINLIFDPITKILEIKTYGGTSKVINKIQIYRKLV